MTGRAKNTKKFKNFEGRIKTIRLMPHNLVFGSTPEMTVFWRGPGVTGRAKNTKNFKNFDGHIKTIRLTPHNLVFGLTPKMTVLGGGFRTLWRCPGVTGRAKDTKKIKNLDGRIEMITLTPHRLVFGLTPEKTAFGGFQDPSEGSWGDWKGQKTKKSKILMGPSIQLHWGPTTLFLVRLQK